MQNVPMMQPPKKGMPTWLIVVLVVAGLGVVLVSTLGVLAIYGTRKYIAAAKSAEALNGIGAIARSAAGLYDPANGAPLCESASGKVPVLITAVSGKKYQSSSTDWTVDEGSNAGFFCLKFSMTMPQYFQYDYRRTGNGQTPGDQFDAIANGDLNGNGFASGYDLQGQIGTGGVVDIAPRPVITNEGE